MLDLLERTPTTPADLFTAAMVVQHEQQHDETMLATLQLRSRPAGADRGRAAAAAAHVDTDRVFVAGGEFALGVDGVDEPFSLDNERPAHTVDVAGRSGSAACR